MPLRARFLGFKKNEISETLDEFLSFGEMFEGDSADSLMASFYSIVFFMPAC